MSRQYIKAILRGESFALPLEKVAAVVKAGEREAAEVPFAPHGVCGLIFYNGEAIILMDAFGECARPARLAIVYKSGERRAACTADSVEGFISITDEEAEEMRAKGAANDKEPDMLRL